MGEKSGHFQFQNEPLMPQNMPMQGGFQQPPPAQYYPQVQPSVPGAAYPPVAQEMYQHQQPPPPYQAQPPPQPLPPVATAPVATVATVQPGQAVQVVQVVANPYVKLGPNPQTMTCPHCQATIITSISAEPSTISWLIGLGLCGVGLICCACIPCCISSLDDVTHKCPQPQCKKTIGHYKGKL